MIERSSFLAGAAAALVAGAFLLATEPALSIAWDEGYTLGRLARVRAWFQAVADPSGFAASWRPPVIESVQDARPRPRPDQFDTRAELFSAPVLAWFWPFGREEPHGHPPFYAIVAMLGDVLTPWRLPLGRARLGTMLAVSLAAGAVLASSRRRWGAWPAAAAASALVLQPRLFAEAHYATYDALLTSLWVGAIVAFAAAIDRGGRSPRWGWAVVFGVLCGWAADTKLTGWFLPLPFLGWMILRIGWLWSRPRDHGSRRHGRGLADETTATPKSGDGWAEIVRGLKTLGVAAVGGTLTLYVFNPPWWPDPWGGLWRFFASNLSRAETIPISTMFLGRIYETPVQSLPAYNTLVWVAFVTPVGFLVLAVVGSGRVVWEAIGTLVRKDTRSFGESVASQAPSEEEGAYCKVGERKAVGRATSLTRPLRGHPLPGGEGSERGLALASLALLHGVFLLALRALPHTPGHDGVRQFLPAFGCLALLVAPGVAWIMDRSMRLGYGIAGAAMVEGLVSIAVMMPVPLSYYSPIVGGLPGAARLGMEPTYYWDALTFWALDELNRRTPPSRSVLFATNPTSWFYLRETKQLRAGIAPFDPGEPMWYVLQNRPGAMQPVDRMLIEQSGPRHVLVSRLGVPLVWVFPFEAYRRASRATARSPL